MDSRLSDPSSAAAAIAIVTIISLAAIATGAGTRGKGPAKSPPGHSLWCRSYYDAASFIRTLNTAAALRPGARSPVPSAGATKPAHV